MSRTRFARPQLGDDLRKVEAEPQQEVAAHQPEHDTGRAPATLHRAMQVGAADDRAEHEADAVADQVLARLAVPHEHGAGCGHDLEAPVRRAAAPTAGATIGAAGGQLDTDSSDAIAAAKGGGSALPAGIRREMEAGFGQSLSDVRIHTDERAAGLSRGMSARAFTTGSDIFFDKGEFAPHTAEGKHVLAHEIAHTRQDAGVRRKLRGTAEALRAQGDEKGDKGKSSGFLRKVVGKLTNWDKLVAAVQAYEAEEGKLLAGGKNPSPIVLAKAKPGMLKLLTKIQTLIAEWRTANDDDAVTSAAEAKGKKIRDTGDFVESDIRSKAGRRQAVSMLQPRVGHEITLLSAKDGSGWLASLGLSTGQVTKVGESKSGQVNTTNQLDYQTESGAFSGYFKEDKGINTRLLSHEDAVGIEQHDPNYGARSVALYRLDQIFDANVTARAEFAVGKDKKGKSVLGTVLQSAGGTSGADMQYRTDADGPGGGKTSLDDPVLQRGLNKLQILDAISGQLDRHMGNYYVQTDKTGAVTGVTGIDLDMAFGKNMTTTGKVDDAHNFKGLPEFIDKAMGDKILAVKEGDIRDALTGLLPEAEIAATLSRFKEVQQAVRDAAGSGRLRADWNAVTAVEGVSWAKSDQTNTYHQQAKDIRRDDIDAAADRETVVLARELLHRGQWSEMPDVFYTSVEKALGFGGFTMRGRAEGLLAVAVATYVFENHLPLKAVPAVAKIVTEALFRSVNVNKLAIELQEWDPTQMAKFDTHVRTLLEKTLVDLMPKLQRRLAAANGR